MDPHHFRKPDPNPHQKHFEEQDPHQDPHQREKSDPGPKPDLHRSEKKDPVRKTSEQLVQFGIDYIILPRKS
jgi:hypothetical protein